MKQITILLLFLATPFLLLSQKSPTFDNLDALVYQSDSETYWFFKGNEC